MGQLGRVLGALALAAVVGATCAQGSPVEALSCAIHPDGTPESIVGGSAQLSTGEPFFDRYDFAITGIVTDVETDEASGSDTYGQTTVTVSVMYGFGLDHVAAEIRLTQGDPGWMVGYPFAVGHTYFIPVEVVGPNGERNYSFVCDPITEIEPDRAAALAADAIVGVIVSSPADAPPTDPTPTTAVTTTPDTTAPQPVPSSVPASAGSSTARPIGSSDDDQATSAIALVATSAVAGLLAFAGFRTRRSATTA